MEMLGAVCMARFAAMLYFLFKFIAASNALAAYMFWVESKGIEHPSKTEFNACRKEVLRQQFKWD